MTLHVTLAEAGARLVELVARVREGEEVLIDEDGRPVARLGPAPEGDKEAEPERPSRRIGVWSHLGVCFDAAAFLQSDPSLDALMDAPITLHP